MSPHAEQPTSSGDSPAASTRPRRRVRRWLVVAGVALLAYAAFGFFLAPRLLRNVLQDQGSAALRRQVTVADVNVNPFTLAVTVVGLEVADLGAPRLAGWESLYVRLAPWKLLQRTAGLAELRLTRPFGRLALDPSGRLNVDDLLGGEEPAPPAQPEARRATLAVALDLLEIVEARLVFEDASRNRAFQTTLGPLTIRLTDFHSRGDIDSPYAFSGSTERGETFSWRGTVLSNPIRSSGTISLAGFQLPKYDPYLRDLGPSLLIESGVVSVGAQYQLEWGEASRKIQLSGLRVLVEDLALARRRDRSRAIQVPRLELSGGGDRRARTGGLGGGGESAGRSGPGTARAGRDRGARGDAGTATGAPGATLGREGHARLEVDGRDGGTGAGGGGGGGPRATAGGQAPARGGEPAPVRAEHGPAHPALDDGEAPGRLARRGPFP